MIAFVTLIDRTTAPQQAGTRTGTWTRPPRCLVSEMPDTLTILNIETHVLLVPDVNPEAMSSSQDEFRPSPAPRSTPPATP